MSKTSRAIFTKLAGPGTGKADSRGATGVPGGPDGATAAGSPAKAIDRHTGADNAAAAYPIAPARAHADANNAYPALISVQSWSHVVEPTPRSVWYSRSFICSASG